MQPIRVPRLSPTVMLGLRTGLALALAYWIALSMDWSKPVWAGFSVASVSLDTVGASVQRGVVRVIATLLGGLVGLLLIALFPQERWWFISAMSLWCGFACYRMLSGRASYAWLIAGFTCPVVAILSGPPDGLNAFSIAIERMQETSTGVVAFSLVALVLTPGSARQRFADSSSGLLQGCLQLWQQLVEQGSTEELQQQRARIRAALRGLPAQLEAAAQVSGLIHERRRQWQRTAAGISGLMEALQRSRDALRSLPPELVARLQTQRQILNDALPQRLRWIEAGCHEDQPRPTPPAALLTAQLPPALDRDGLTEQQQAQLQLGLASLQELDQRSLALVQLWLSTSQASAAATPDRPRRLQGLKDRLWQIDPDRLLEAGHVALAVWIGSLLWIYLPGLPDGPLVVAFLAAFSMIVAGVPGISGANFLPCVALSLVATTGIYMLVLPHLEGFTQLALLLVGISLGYHILLKNQPLVRVIGIVVMVIFLQITNLQSFNILSVFNVGLSCLLCFLILVFSPEIPFSTRAEKVWLRQFARFRSSCAALMAEPNPQASGWQRGWRTFHRSELQRLPARLIATSQRLHGQELGITPAQLTELLEAIELTALWLRELQTDGKAAANAGQHGMLQQNLERLARAEAAIDWTPWRQTRFSWF